MCDTIYLKKDNIRYFAKNSDRSPNEAHLMIRKPAMDYKEGSLLKTTYITIDQVSHTYNTVLLKPVWTWGAEMGWNEFGLNIGNEAIFTKEKREKKEGLIGMDLLRLALERARNAREAVEVITSLLTKFGQGGNCGYDKKFYYDNAFLIADPKETLLLETMGRKYTVKEVNDSLSISNCIDTKEDYYKADGIKGNFKAQYENKLVTYFAGSEKRKAKSFREISKEGEPISLLKDALRSHYSEDIDITRASTNSVCMHAGNLFGDQTTGSYVCEIGKTYFVTGSSFPCISIFKPVGVNALVLSENEEEAKKYWFKRELLNRHLMCGNINKEEYIKEAKALEEKYYLLALNAKDQDELEKISSLCFKEENDLVDRYFKSSEGKEMHFKGSPYFKHYWTKMTKELNNDYSL